MPAAIMLGAVDLGDLSFQDPLRMKLEGGDGNGVGTGNSVMKACAAPI